VFCTHIPSPHSDLVLIFCLFIIWTRFKLRISEYYDLIAGFYHNVFSLFSDRLVTVLESIILLAPCLVHVLAFLYFSVNLDSLHFDLGFSTNEA
jgi:hypothetical protein